MTTADLAMFTDDEALTIYGAFTHISAVLDQMGPDGERNSGNLLRCQNAMADFLGAQPGNQVAEPWNRANAMALVLFEFGLGVEEKERIGLENDTYRHPDCLNPILNDAFVAGQEAARLNWLLEQGFLASLFRRKGQLNQHSTREALRRAEEARQPFLRRHYPAPGGRRTK